MISREEATSQGDRSVVVSRVIDAPRESVWRAWMDPNTISKWFAPEPMKIPRAVIEPRPGGEFSITMADEDGNEFTSTGNFIEVMEPERAVYTDSSSMMPQGFLDMVNDARGVPHGTEIPDGTVTLTFEDMGGKTKMTFAEEFDSKATRDAWIEMQMVEGLEGSFDNLEKLLTATPSMAR